MFVNHTKFVIASRFASNSTLSSYSKSPAFSSPIALISLTRKSTKKTPSTAFPDHLVRTVFNPSSLKCVPVSWLLSYITPSVFPSNFLPLQPLENNVIFPTNPNKHHPAPLTPVISKVFRTNLRPAALLSRPHRVTKRLPTWLPISLFNERSTGTRSTLLVGFTQQPRLSTPGPARHF